MPRTVTVNFSLTETRQFRRLVDFLVDMDSLARINADDEIRDLVDKCRADLLDDDPVD